MSEKNFRPIFWTDGKKGTELKKVKVNKRTSPTTHRIRKTSAKAISRTGSRKKVSLFWGPHFRFEFEVPFSPHGGDAAVADARSYTQMANTPINVAKRVKRGSITTGTAAL